MPPRKETITDQTKPSPKARAAALQELQKAIGKSAKQSHTNRDHLPDQPRFGAVLTAISKHIQQADTFASNQQPDDAAEAIKIAIDHIKSIKQRAQIGRNSNKLHGADNPTKTFDLLDKAQSTLTDIKNNLLHPPSTTTAQRQAKIKEPKQHQYTSFNFGRKD